MVALISWCYVDYLLENVNLSKHHTTGDFTKSELICEDCDQRNVDKSDVMIYNSKFDIKERVKKVSTTYQEIAE